MTKNNNDILKKGCKDCNCIYISLSSCYND